MNSNFLLRSIRIVLFPFSLLYGAIIICRNWMYNKNYFKSVSFNLPIINVGNLSVGGTGKSPMVEFIVNQLQSNYKLAILSRGYRRKTKGYLVATDNTTALDIGDEPLMFYNQFKNCTVAVGEDRVLAVPHILQDAPNTQVIILDDAFQHRAIKASCNIVLTDFHNLYMDDFFLPTGDLRDQKGSISRAQIIVVTKCPEDLSTEKKEEIITHIKPLATQSVFFTTIHYSNLKHLLTNENIFLQSDMEVLLVTGIANPQPIERKLLAEVHSYEKMQFRDHHVFDIDDIKNIEKQFNKINNSNKIIITTQKDAMRLNKFGNDLKHLPIYILPIEIKFLFEEQIEFTAILNNHILNFSKG